jgi:hypothetical protein
MDNVAFGHIFAFTGIDIYAKESDILLWPALTSEDGVAHLQTACLGALRDLSRFYNTMAARNLKGRQSSRPAIIATGIALPVLTKRTSRPILKASAAHYARNARAGGHIRPTNCRA